MSAIKKGAVVAAMLAGFTSIGVESAADLADIERQQRESLEDAIRKTAEREAK